jgi:hypothetical protein
VGDPIDLVLRICNTGRDPLFVFVPGGRADGLQLRAVAGDGLEIAGPEGEPEPGLVGELRLDAGDCHDQAYPLGDWIAGGSPGTHLLECGIEVEVARESLRVDRRTERHRVAFAEAVSLALEEHAA